MLLFDNVQPESPELLMKQLDRRNFDAENGFREEKHKYCCSLAPDNDTQLF